MRLLNTPYRIYNRDCLRQMCRMPENTVDSIITDPPYGLKFMGKLWDRGVPGVPFWEAALRVAKPGAILLAFGGTRTYHRLVCAIEDAGWEIRDCVMWLYGQGFPKSHDISKALDKAVGAKRKKVRVPAAKACNPKSIRSGHGVEGGDRPYMQRAAEKGFHEIDDNEPVSELARQWQGWGTGLKPAHELICVAMKPLDGTFAENAEKWGVAGLAIDRGRVEFVNEADKGDPHRFQKTGGNHGCFLASENVTSIVGDKGRWPANVILSHHPECVQAGTKKVKTGTAVGKKASSIYGTTLTDKGKGKTTYASTDGLETVEAWECHPDCPIGVFPRSDSTKGKGKSNKPWLGGGTWSDENTYSDSGSAARFFYTAKASRKERNAGLQGLPQKNLAGANKWTDVKYDKDRGKIEAKKQENHHPTVKPIALMEYLCRLTSTPEGGIVLDPFMGSGSTGVACAHVGRQFIGIEKDREHGYFEIARMRLEAAYAEADV